MIEIEYELSVHKGNFGISNNALSLDGKVRLTPDDEYKTMIGKCTDWVVKDKLINDILYEVREIVEHKVSYELADEIEAKIKKIYGVE